MSGNRPLTPQPLIQQLVTFLCTTDLEATHDFYAGILGLPLVLDQGACRIFGVTETAFVGFCRQTTHIEGVVAQGVILTLVVDSEAQVDAWHLYVQAAGSSNIEKPPVLNEQFNIYHLFLRDPNGYLVEVQSFLDPQWPRVPKSETT